MLFMASKSLEALRARESTNTNRVSSDREYLGYEGEVRENFNGKIRKR